MKFSGILPVLSTILAIGQVSPAVAEPIPAEARVHSLRALQDGAVLESISKRDLPSNLFGTDGLGAKYWAWAKLAYDDEYNNQPGKKLGNANGKAWAKLGDSNGNSDIFVKGHVGNPVAGIWGDTFTGMKVVVGKDNTNKVVVMSFIGTNDKPTAKQDGKFAHATDSSGAIPGQLTKGFYECYSSVQQQAFKWAKEYAIENQDWDIVITGHSLGGATAQIAAAGWAFAVKEFFPRTTLITYGAPRSGDLEFHEKLAELYQSRIYNFQHIHDIVPHMPLLRVPFAKYANAAGRYVFESKGNNPSWFNGDLWSGPLSADTEGDIRESLVGFAKDAFDNFAQHKEYFSATTPPGRRSIDLEDRSTPSVHKREVPNERDYQTAQGLIDQIMQSNELAGESVELTKNLEALTVALKNTSEQGELVEALNSYGSEAERVEFLRYMLVGAMNQAQ